MRNVVALMFAVFLLSIVALAQSPSPTVSPSAAPVASATSAVTLATPSPATVSQPPSPPQWAEDVLMAAQKLPILGPYVAKALLWAGIIGTCLSALCLCLITICASLSSVLNIAGVTSLSQKIQKFQNGKIMYWLKYFSFLNAQTPKV